MVIFKRLLTIQIIVHWQKSQLKLTIELIKLMGNKIGMIKIIWLEQEHNNKQKKEKDNKANNNNVNVNKNQIMLIGRQIRDIQLVSFFKKGGYAETHYRGNQYGVKNKRKMRNSNLRSRKRI